MTNSALDESYALPLLQWIMRGEIGMHRTGTIYLGGDTAPLKDAIKQLFQDLLEAHTILDNNKEPTVDLEGLQKAIGKL